MADVGPSSFFPVDFNNFSDAEYIPKEIRRDNLYGSVSDEYDSEVRYVSAPLNSTAISPAKDKENVSASIVNRYTVSHFFFTY